MKKKATQLTSEVIIEAVHDAVRKGVEPLEKHLTAKIENARESVRAELKDSRDYSTQRFNKLETKLEHVEDDVDKIKLAVVDLLPIAQHQQKNDTAINLLEQRVDKLEATHG